MEFHPSCGRVHTIICMHHMDTNKAFAQSAGPLEYTDCISAEG